MRYGEGLRAGQILLELGRWSISCSEERLLSINGGRGSMRAFVLGFGRGAWAIWEVHWALDSGYDFPTSANSKIIRRK